MNENNFEILFYLGIKTINDFSLILQKKKNPITVDSLYDLLNNVIKEINELKIDNKKIQNENQELKKENQELKKEIQGIKKENQDIKKEIKEIKDKQIKKEEEIEILKDSKIVNNKEDKKLILDWIKPDTKIKFNLLYQVSRDGDRISTFT